MLKTAIILTVFLPNSFAITKCATEPWSGKEKCTDVSEAELEMWNEIKEPNYTYAGHSFDWSDPQDGWNDYRRLNLLNGIKLHPEVNAKKPKYHSKYFISIFAPKIILFIFPTKTEEFSFISSI